MAKRVAEIFIETLVNAGVKRVYGVVGDSLNGLTEIIRKSKQIEWVHVRHEEVAAFAAGAEAHLTGEIAVCAGSCGPGNLHLINGLFDCHRNRAPVLAVAAQIPSHEIGRTVRNHTSQGSAYVVPEGWRPFSIGRHHLRCRRNFLQERTVWARRNRTGNSISKSKELHSEHDSSTARDKRRHDS
jgi:hypothetical protein